MAIVVALAVVLPQMWSVTGLLDLRIYLGSAAQIRIGQSIYDYQNASYGLGSTYPPLWSLLVLPLTWLDVHLVEVGVTVANSVLWYVVLRGLAAPVRPAGGLAVPAPALVAMWAASLASAAVWNTLNQGQVNILIWLLVAVDLRWCAEGRSGAGALTGLAAAVKLHPLGVLAVLAAAGRWRAALVGAASFAGATALAAVLRWEDSVRFWSELIFDTGRIGGLADDQNNSLRAVAAHLGLADGAAGAVGVVAAFALTGGLFVLTARAMRRALSGGALVAAALVVGCWVALASPISWTHHLVFGAFALLLLWDRSRRTGANLGLLVGAALILVDPVGFGRLALTSDIRALAMIAAIAAAGRLVAIEVRLRGERWGPLPNDTGGPSGDDGGRRCEHGARGPAGDEDV